MRKKKLSAIYTALMTAHRTQVNLNIYNFMYNFSKEGQVSAKTGKSETLFYLVIIIFLKLQI